MKIPKNHNCVTGSAPSFDKGTGPFDNPGIQPVKGEIKDSPGEKQRNSPGVENFKKGQPFGKGGSGYTD